MKPLYKCLLESLFLGVCQGFICWHHKYIVSIIVAILCTCLIALYVIFSSQDINHRNFVKITKTQVVLNAIYLVCAWVPILGVYMFQQLSI